MRRPSSREDLRRVVERVDQLATLLEAALRQAHAAQSELADFQQRYPGRELEAPRERRAKR